MSNASSHKFLFESSVFLRERSVSEHYFVKLFLLGSCATTAVLPTVSPTFAERNAWACAAIAPDNLETWKLSVKTDTATVMAQTMITILVCVSCLPPISNCGYPGWASCPDLAMNDSVRSCERLSWSCHLSTKILSCYCITFKDPARLCYVLAIGKSWREHNTIQYNTII